MLLWYCCNGVGGGGDKGEGVVAVVLVRVIVLNFSLLVGGVSGVDGFLFYCVLVVDRVPHRSSFLLSQASGRPDA